MTDNQPNCKTCSHFRENCPLPKEMLLRLLSEFGTDWQAMIDKLDSIKPMDTGLDNFLKDVFNGVLADETDGTEE